MGVLDGKGIGLVCVGKGEAWTGRLVVGVLKTGMGVGGGFVDGGVFVKNPHRDVASKTNKEQTMSQLILLIQISSLQPITAGELYPQIVIFWINITFL